MKFVIIVKVDRDLYTDGGLSGKYYWEVRELLKKGDSDVDLLERTGPMMARGVAVDNVTARSAAEAAADALASEAIYVYETPPKGA